MHKQMFALFLLLGVCGASFATEIPVIGMNSQGQETITYIPKSKYARGVALMIRSAQEEAVPALDKAKQGKRWRLRTVALGIGVDIKLGFSPFFELGITPRFRALLTNSTNPVIP